MDETLPGLTEDPKELTPLTVIRTETALSRFPVHRIAKKGNVRIELKQQVSALLWRVSYNSEYGQPGPLAYKLDTLVVNRRIDEAGRPVPKLIRLGSLRDIAEEIGTGEKNTNVVKNALLQNASAFINAKISYKGADRSEKQLEAAFTRYSLVFTGETLPDGRSADAVYLVLNDVYMEVLNAAVHRPLDYDYMKALPPAAQRFYEILSYQIYAALHFRNERARLRYSEYCLLSTATRYLDFDHVKKQMYKIHRPHLESGYLAKVNFEETTDADGQPDWWIYYVPGPNASREYQDFTGNVRRPSAARGSRKETKAEALPLPFPEFGESQAVPPDAVVAASVAEAEARSEAAMALAEELAAAGLNRKDAERFARERPDECRRQLAHLPFVTGFRTSRGAYLRKAIEDGYAPPPAYVKQQEAEEARRRTEGEAERRKARQAAQDARRREEAARVDSEMDRLEKDEPEAFSAFTAYVAGERRKVEARYANMSATIRAKMLKTFDASSEKRRELFQQWRAPRDPLTKDEPAAHPAAPTRRAASKPSRVAGDQNRATAAGDVGGQETPEQIRALLQASFAGAEQSRENTSE